MCNDGYGGSDCRYTMVKLSETVDPVGFIDLAKYPRVPFIPDVSKVIGGAVETGVCNDITKPFWCGVVSADVQIATDKAQSVTEQCAASLGACLGSDLGEWSKEGLVTEESYSGLENNIIANGTQLKVVKVVASTNQKDADKVAVHIYMCV